MFLLYSKLMLYVILLSIFEGNIKNSSVKKLIFLSALLIEIISVNAQQPTFITDSLDTYITREMQRWNIPGVAIAIVKDGKVMVMKEYGVRDLDSKQKVDENTLFRIGSCTKAL